MDKNVLLEQLHNAIGNSPAHQQRLTAAASEPDAVTILLEIAHTEGIALEPADIQQQLAAASQQNAGLTDEELARISGGHAGTYRDRPAWSSYLPNLFPDQYPR
ncbi:hypothetical protein [Oceanibaculum indicum]|uniref:Uncharacterized protein n=1 Tax=Oceanibaculum indicum TaxID=526216 RepID=A0A420WPN8_9PROT|nr:hypothetical protein [Oceanibaculum indicum]RKQ72836.1 hypothetical protein BCL74_0606 [Oceanibaculum indicum]